MLSGWTGGSRELAHETFASRRLRPSTLRAPKCLVRLTCPHDATLGRSRAALKDDLVQHPDACAMGMQCDARCVVPSPPHAPRAPNRATHVRSFDLLGRPSLNANFEGKLVSWEKRGRGTGGSTNRHSGECVWGVGLARTMEEDGALQDRGVDAIVAEFET